MISMYRIFLGNVVFVNLYAAEYTNKLYNKMFKNPSVVWLSVWQCETGVKWIM